MKWVAGIPKDKCKEKQKSTLEVTNFDDLVTYLNEEPWVTNFLMNDEHDVLRKALTGRNVGQVFESCNLDKCPPGDTIADNMLEALNSLLVDAGNPNLKICSA